MGKLTGDMTEEFDSAVVEKSHEHVPNGNIVSIWASHSSSHSRDQNLIYELDHSQ